MAVLFMESFDHFTGAVAGVKGWQAGGSGSVAASPVRTGVGAMSVAASGAGKQVRSLGGDYVTIISGFAFREGSPGGGLVVCSLRDNGQPQVELRRLSSGNLRVTRGGVTLGSGSLVLVENVWYYIEVKFTINDTTGAAEVRVNGVTDISLTNVDTKISANAYANEITYEQSAAGASFDDIYVLDTSGGAPANDFLGDVKVEALLPSGNGNSSQFDGSDGNQVDNYLLVDEANPNSDTDYVESGDVNDKDTYAYSNLASSSGTVYAVQALPYLRKTDAGTKNAVTVARLSATEVDSSTLLVSDTYRYIADVRSTKPGGGAWTITDVNNAEFGLKVV